MVYDKKRGMRSKRSTRRKPTSKSSKSLTKTEKTQVKKIAKSVVNTMVESKYFNVNGGITDVAPSPIVRDNSNINSSISCYGFTTGARANSDTNQRYQFGVNPITGAAADMTTLNMNQVFRTSDSVASRQNYAIEGLTCRPAYNECQWLFERPQAVTTSDGQKAQPYKIRMIRLVPRALKASAQSIDPQNDMFLDALNEPYGPASISGTEPFFGVKDFHLAKVNSRRYRVLEDTGFTMLPSTIATEVANTTTNVDLVNNPSASGYRVLKTKHNIGKELYYQNPDSSAASGGSQYPTTGFEPEFVLFLICAIGGEQGFGDLTDNLVLSARPVSTFKDA